MSTRSILIAALAIAGLAACKTNYNDVYSFKKNSFRPPPTKRTEIKAPETPNIPGTQATPPGASEIPGIPGLTPPPPPAGTPAPAPTGIPGLDAPPAPPPTPATPPAI